MEEKAKSNKNLVRIIREGAFGVGLGAFLYFYSGFIAGVERKNVEKERAEYKHKIEWFNEAKSIFEELKAARKEDGEGIKDRWFGEDIYSSPLDLYELEIMQMKADGIESKIENYENKMADFEEEIRGAEQTGRYGKRLGLGIIGLSALVSLGRYARSGIFQNQNQNI